MVVDKSFKKVLFSSVVALVVVALLAWFVMAAAVQANSRILSPASGTNHSGSNSAAFVVNFTFINGTGGIVNIEGHIGTLNATFYYNITPTEWAIIGNVTHCFNNPGAIGIGTNVSCFGPLNLSQNVTGARIPDGKYLLNATIFNGSVWAEISKLGIGFTSNLSEIIIDNTEPLNVNITSLTSGNNHSIVTNPTNLTLNVSVADARTGISTVIFNIINATGVLNDTLIGVQEGNTHYWSTSMNLSHYLDGTYNITFMVNDTAGNYNLTANGTTYHANSMLRLIRIDNTKPVATPACSPTTVDVGGAFPCTCASSDVTSGVNSSAGTSTSPDGIGAIVNTGGFTYTCTVVDRAGNTGVSSTTYTVDSGGSTGSSSSGSSGSSGSSAGSTGSSGSTAPSNGSSTGSTGSASGTGASGQGQGALGSASEGKLGMGWIIAIIVIAAIVVGIIIMVKRKN